MEDGVRFLLRDDRGLLLDVSTPRTPWPLAWGEPVRLSLAVHEVSGQRNPGGRDRSLQAMASGISFEGSSRRPPVRLAPPSLLSHLEVARLDFGSAVDRAMPPREASLVRAIGAGDTRTIAPATRDSFARSGLAHLLSVSGLHLAVVAVGLFRLLGWLLNRWDHVALRLDPRRWAAALTIPATVLYALATGAQVPVVRSAIVAASLFLGVMLDREGDSLNTLSLAALAILAIDPGALFDPSFQLSFASVGGLTLLSGPFRRAIPLQRRGGIPGHLQEAMLSACCASLAANIATAPIVAFHFHRISLLSLPANLLGVPLGAGLTILAALAALVSAASLSLAVPLLWICRPLATLLLFVNDIFAAPSWAVVELASPGTAATLVCLILVLASLRLTGTRRLLAAGGAAALLLLPGPIRRLAAMHRGGLEAVFVSVGQGDAAILRLPDGAGVLIDAGGVSSGNYDPGAREIVPLLLDMGIRRLAAAFVSHPHADHLLGLPSVTRSFPPERLYSNGQAGDEVARSAWDRLPATRKLVAGDALELSGVHFEVLAPPAGEETLGENDRSLVLRVVHGETSFLFLGDLETTGTEALLASGRSLDAQVVKVAHHGSRTGTSPALASAIKPSWGVISVASRNRYGLPHQEAVELWKGVGAEVVRTDQKALRFFSNGRTIQQTVPDLAVDAWALWREGLSSASSGVSR